MTEGQSEVEPSGDGPLARALLHQAEAISELRRDLARLASETTDTLTSLSERLDEFEAGDRQPLGGGTVLAWCWRTLGPQGQDALWQELTGWVNWLRMRYPLARKIPDCWHEHPEIVEELTALWVAWQAAYTEPDAALTAASDWHDRWLPGVLYRLEHGPFAIDCINGHQSRPATAYAHPTDEHKRSEAAQRTGEQTSKGPDHISSPNGPGRSI